jgi:hypothetical protein
MEPDPFTPHHFSAMKAAPEGMYAMWWALESEPSFEQSDEVANIRRWYAAAEGYEIWLAGAFLSAAGLIEQFAPARITEEGFEVALEGPEYRPVIFAASAEKGLRFFLPTKAPLRYRRLFWANLAWFGEDFRRQMREQGLQPEPLHGGTPQRWLDSLLRPRTAKGEQLQYIGACPIGNAGLSDMGGR